LGWGICGWNLFYDGYPHNIFLEFLVDFGILISLIIIIVTIIITLTALIKTQKKDKDLLIIFFLSGYIPLIFSNSYKMYVNFWIFLFFTLSVFNKTYLKRL
jgi:O-antigen ligase